MKKTGIKFHIINIRWWTVFCGERFFKQENYKGPVPLTLNYATSMNCIVGIKSLKILLPVYPHSTAFKNVIALNYLIILKQRNVEWWRFSVHLPEKTNRVSFLNVKSLVYLNKSCTTTFCRQGYGLKENDSSI